MISCLARLVTVDETWLYHSLHLFLRRLIILIMHAFVEAYNYEASYLTSLLPIMFLSFPSWVELFSLPCVRSVLKENE